MADQTIQPRHRAQPEMRWRTRCADDWAQFNASLIESLRQLEGRVGPDGPLARQRL
jgi:hypothetical protein